VEGVRWLLRDVTREKEIQAALVQAEKLSTAGRLAASLAHEINNPLCAALGWAELAQESLEEGQKPTQHLEIVREALARASRVVSQLRELHRDGRSEERQLADLNELVDDVLLLTRKQANSAGIEISCQQAEDLPALPLMVDGIQQVFLNLVLNAIEAMDGGGHLDVCTRYAPCPPRVGVVFADDGPGIAPEVRDALFEPFRTTKAEGSGLGLFISHNIVQQHDGWIEVESAAGEGATFTVWLPLKTGTGEGNV
jgi:signal transduction histidine kinase